jgi:glycosyltransferase involved in cell wall biosynthesis
MRYLFVHQNFPAQFVHILRHLAAQQQHDLVFLTENRGNALPGVRKIFHGLPQAPGRTTHRDARDFELATIRADGTAMAAQKLKSLGYQPDIIIGHHGWGEMLNMKDVWPDVPLLGYQEYYYHERGKDVGFDPEFPLAPQEFARVRAKNALNLLTLTNPGHGFTPTHFQQQTYPVWARDNITVLHEGVNLDVCKPEPKLRQRAVSLGGYKIAPADKLVTYVVRDLEPYRGFHIMMRALPRILRERPDVRVILVGGDLVSYGVRPPEGTWRKTMLDELGSALDLSRVHFTGRVPYETYVKILQRSDTHVYLTYPFVASWSLREAMATGCAIVASDTEPVHEFITHRKTGLLVPFLEPARVAEGVLKMLEDDALNRRLRRAARTWAEQHLRMDDYLAGYERLIAKVIA